MKSNWAAIPTILGKFLYLQISASIVDKSIVFNIVESKHDIATELVSIPMFSRTMISISKVTTTIIAKPSFSIIYYSMHDTSS